MSLEHKKKTLYWRERGRLLHNRPFPVVKRLGELRRANRHTSSSLVAVVIDAEGIKLHRLMFSVTFSAHFRPKFYTHTVPGLLFLANTDNTH